MAKFELSFYEFKENVNEFLKNYLILSDKAPFTDSFLNGINDTINNIEENLKENNILLDNYLGSLDNVYNELLYRYNLKKKEYDNSITNTKKVIEEKYRKRILEEKNNIVLIRRNNKSSEAIIKQDINSYINSSKEKNELLEQEYIENKNRFDYQIKAAFETYEENIRKRDFILDNALTKVNADYAVNLKQFDIDCKEIIEKHNKNIVKLNEKLSELEVIEQSIENKNKAQARQESIDFNALIKKLQDEKNKEIVIAKDNYTTSLNDDNIEKENKHKINEGDIQIVMKEFVSKINTLDEELNEIKQIYQKDYNLLKQKYFYELLAINKNQNHELKSAMSIDYEQKKYIKAIRKKYYHQQQTTKQKSLQALRSLEIEYNCNLENIRHERAIAELNKNQALKKLTENEQSTNKHYQEQSNIYENRMNLDIFMANSNYNKEANKCKCESRKRTIAFQKDYTNSLLHLRKEIKSVMTEIKRIELKRNSVEELNKILHKEESETFDRKTRYLEINTLLEIEKHKALKIYNEKQYEYNITNAQTVLDYSKEKISIKNSEYETLNHISIDLNRARTDREINRINHHITTLGIEEYEEKTIQTRNIQYELDSLMHNTIKDRYNREILSINRIASIFIIHVRHLEIIVSSMIRHFNSELKIRQEYIKTIYEFIDDFMDLIEHYYFDLFENFYAHELEMINDRLLFEENFKFKENYEAVRKGYETDITQLKKKKNEGLSQIEDLKKANDIASSRIASMYNQIEHVKNSSKTPEAKQKEIHQLRLRITILKSNIANNQSKITAMYNDVEIIDKEMKDIEIRYNKQNNDLKELQYNSAKSFHNLGSSLKALIENSKNRISVAIRRSPDLYNLNSVRTLTSGIIDSFKSANSLIFRDLYNLLNKFAKENDEALLKDKRLLLQKFRNDLFLINDDVSKKFNSNQSELEKEMNKSNEHIANLEHEYKSKTQYFKNQMFLCDKSFELRSNEILSLKNQSTQQFYSSFYAVDDNSKSIDNDYNHHLDLIHTEFNNKKDKLISNEENGKLQLQQELTQYITQNDESINHLPEATRLQTTEAEDDTKNKNKDIDLSISNSKEKYHLSQKSINKNIDDIRSNLNSNIYEIEANYQQDLRQETVNYQNNIKRIQKGIFERK